MVDALILGIGEIGGPISELLSTRWNVAELDVDRDPDVQRADFMHVCYPYQIEDFVKTTVEYADRFEPQVVVIHSTVIPGTTDAVQSELRETPVFYSPVRGKHWRMTEDLRRYRKFVSGPDAAFGIVATHLSEAGFPIDTMKPIAALELAKLLETSYFGVLIAWAQETERLAKKFGSDHATVSQYFEEVPFLPDGYFPGEIGGHCVLPNIELLGEVGHSFLLDAVGKSNERFKQEQRDN